LYDYLSAHLARVVQCEQRTLNVRPTDSVVGVDCRHRILPIHRRYNIAIMNNC
jgi:hypothetical protein